MKINLRPRDMSDSKNNSSRFWKSLLKQFFPVFLIAAMLPVGLAVVLNPEGLTIFSRASNNQELRLWLEPANIILHPGDRIKMQVMGEFADERKLLPQLKAFVQADNSLQLTPDAIVYLKPFRGRLELGTVTVQPTQTGLFTIDLPVSRVETNSNEPVTVFVSTATIDVR